MAKDRSLCITGFIPSSVNFWQFGSMFYQGYYVSHYYDAPHLEFQVPPNSPKRAIEAGAPPFFNLKEHNYLMQIAGHIIVVVVAWMTTLIIVRWVLVENKIEWLDPGEEEGEKEKITEQD